MFRRLFLDHPASVNENYAEHFATAAGFGAAMIVGGVAALIHAVLPAACQTTASRTIVRLHARLRATRGADTRAQWRTGDFVI